MYEQRKCYESSDKGAVWLLCFCNYYLNTSNITDGITVGMLDVYVPRLVLLVLLISLETVLETLAIAMRPEALI